MKEKGLQDWTIWKNEMVSECSLTPSQNSLLIQSTKLLTKLSTKQHLLVKLLVNFNVNDIELLTPRCQSKQMLC